MKPKTNKMQLKKQAIANLSKNELENINAGKVANMFTTSNWRCSGITCCDFTATSWNLEN